MISDLCERDECETCFEDEVDACGHECHDPLDSLAGLSRPTTEEPSTGGARQAQDPAAMVPPTAAAPASALPRSASAGPSTPARPSQDPRAGVDPTSSRLGRSRGAGAGRSSSMEADGAVPGGGPRPGRGEPAFLPPQPGQGARTWTIELPPGLPLLSLNHRLHYQERNRRAQAIKEAAWAMARQARVPRLARALVAVEYQPPDRRHRDADNPVASAKAAVDGIVLAGVLEDDECPRYVTGIWCTIGERYPQGRLVLHLTEVAATGSDAA